MKLKPGRELDALIAEKVMNRPIYVAHDGTPHFADLSPKKRDGRVVETPYSIVPSYSTNIAAAWEVVEKMRSLGFTLSLTDWGDKYSVTFVKDNTAMSCVTEKEFPLAVGASALEAIENER